MKKRVTLKAIVELILRNFIKSRGNDKFLIKKYIDIKYFDLNKEERARLVDIVNELKVPSILRCRRWLQNQDINLRDDKYNDRQIYNHTCRVGFGKGFFSA